MAGYLALSRPIVLRANAHVPLHIHLKGKLIPIRLKYIPLALLHLDIPEPKSIPSSSAFRASAYVLGLNSFKTLYLSSLY